MAKENLNLIFGSVGAEMLVSNVTQHQTETSLWLICTTLGIGLCMRLVDVTISLIQKVHGTYVRVFDADKHLIFSVAFSEARAQHNDIPVPNRPRHLLQNCQRKNQR